MSFRFLFGPGRGWIPEGLAIRRGEGRARLFGETPEVDLLLGDPSAWEGLGERMAGGWRPEFVIVDLSRSGLPAGLVRLSCPLVGVISDEERSEGSNRADWRDCDRLVSGPIAQRLFAPGAAADWDKLDALLEHEGQSLRTRARSRRALAELTLIRNLELRLQHDPFELEAARRLAEALRASGERKRLETLAHERRLLSLKAPELVPVESWFARAGPPGGLRTSIVVLCHGQESALRACLDSVFRATRSPFELILADCARSDGVARYLREIRESTIPDRVEVIHPGQGLGLPAIANQGLRAARGQYIMLLTDDVVVTDGWLLGMIRWANHDWPRVGLVGAMSNRAAEPQRVEPNYDLKTLAGLKSFAALRRHEYASKAMRVSQLADFCLLMRREVFDAVGGLDERSGQGMGVNDLCLRARQSGFDILLALDVFIHQRGDQTTSATETDIEPARAADSGGVGRGWDPAVTMVDRVEARATPSTLENKPQPAAPVSRPRVSLCMIVRDEEANIESCLDGIAGLVDEMIVVDTGSTDRTRELAAAKGARIHQFAWIDDFSAARNASLDHARGDWVFWLDADDRVDEVNRRKLAALFDRLTCDNSAYVMSCRCLSDSLDASETVVDHVRLFRNDPGVRWRYPVHEQILPALRKIKADVRFVDVVIDHVGYQDPALRRRKLERDLRILSRQAEAAPDDPFVLFNLGSIDLELGRTGEAIPRLERSLALSHPSDSIVRKLHALLAQAHRRLGQDAQALAAVRAGRRHYPDDVELLFHEALILRGLGDLAGAEVCLRRLIAASAANHFKSIDSGLKTYKARHNLAVVLRQQGRLDEARDLWLEVVAERPDFLPGWLLLGELAVARADRETLELILRSAPDSVSKSSDFAVLRARGLLVEGNAQEALRIVQNAALAFPTAIAPRLLRCQILKDRHAHPDELAAALQDLLAVDPHNDFAKTIRLDMN